MKNKNWIVILKNNCKSDDYKCVIVFKDYNIKKQKIFQTGLS